MVYPNIEDWVPTAQLPPMPQRGTRAHFDRIVHDSAQGLGIDPKRVTWREIGAGMIEIAIERTNKDEIDQLGRYVRDQVNIGIDVAVVGLEAAPLSADFMRAGHLADAVSGKPQEWTSILIGTVPAAIRSVEWNEAKNASGKVVGRTVGRYVPSDPSVPPNKYDPAPLPKFRFAGSVWAKGDGGEAIKVDLRGLHRDDLKSLGDNIAAKDLAIVSWEWAAEQTRREREFFHGYAPKANFANVETIPVADLARRVLLAPDATREQVEGRIDALMKEPNECAAWVADKGKTMNAHEATVNMRLERALDDIATLETRLQESRLVIADQAFMINRMNRKGTK